MNETKINMDMERNKIQTRGLTKTIQTKTRGIKYRENGNLNKIMQIKRQETEY